MLWLEQTQSQWLFISLIHNRPRAVRRARQTNSSSHPSFSSHFCSQLSLCLRHFHSSTSSLYKRGHFRPLFHIFVVSQKLTVCQWLGSNQPPWPDLAKFRHFGKILKALASQFLGGILSIGQSFVSTLTIFNAFWQNFIVVNVQILSKLSNWNQRTFCVGGDRSSNWATTAALHSGDKIYLWPEITFLQLIFSSAILYCSNSTALQIFRFQSLLIEKDWRAVQEAKVPSLKWFFQILCPHENVSSKAINRGICQIKNPSKKKVAIEDVIFFTPLAYNCNQNLFEWLRYWLNTSQTLNDLNRNIWSIILSCNVPGGSLDNYIPVFTIHCSIKNGWIKILIFRFLHNNICGNNIYI